MADLKENELGKQEEEEKKIPVFTVLKNGSILKNIFLLDKPKSSESGENCDKSAQENDETFLVGRHPDCNIVLEHPSISRFHLRINLQPSLQKLSIIDLSSANGTWVLGSKIEPQVWVELNEGDTLSLANSTRIYRLHWVSSSRAFDVENPVVLPQDTLPLEEEEEEMYQDENSNSLIQILIPSAPPIPEAMIASFPEEQEKEEEEILEAAEKLQEGEGQNTSKQILEQDNSSVDCRQPATESVNSSLPVDEQFDKEIESPKSLYPPGLSERENQEIKCNTPSLWSRRGKPISILQLQTGRSRGKNMEAGIDLGNETENQKEISDKLIPQLIFSGSDEEELFTPDKENFTPNTLLRLKSLKKGKLEGSKNSKLLRSLSSNVTMNPNIDKEEELIFTSGQENRALQVLQERKSERPTSGSHSRLDTEKMVSKRKAERVPFQSLLGNSSGKSNSEDSVPNDTRRSSNSVNRSQNITNGNPSYTKLAGEAKRVPSKSLLENSSGKSNSEISVPCATRKSSNSVDHSRNMENGKPSYTKLAGEARGRWNMVVDTTCLLNKESRRSLKLLQGLKGTQLIIPRIVIRELDSLKRRGSLFRSAKEVSSVLQWIEECMMKLKWWIHVQSSVEEVMPIAPTPHSSPRSQVSEGSNGGFAGGTAFSSCGSLMEIVSPTAEDHILESALLFRRIRHDGQLVLLTNDVTLKIKAMAEGLICETAEDFRESLVNPYSERFLWVDSTPRGPNWSCLDEVLRENYNQCPVKKTSKAGESAKGLKLILRHNSHYGKINIAN